MLLLCLFGGVRVNIYVFDNELNLKGLVESYFSLIWTRRYSKVGEFELHCNLDSATVELLQKGNIIWKNDTQEGGYIEHRHLLMDDEGNEIMIIKGKFLTGLLASRIIWGIESINTTSELAIRTLITNHVITPANLDRKINLLELGELKSYVDSIDYKTSYKNLLEEVEGIALSNELGIRSLLDFENKKIVFDIYKGLDRTAGQDINPAAIFSKEFENVLEQEYTDSLENYKNVALVAGEGEGAARTLAVEGEGVGLDRQEIYVDARDLQKETMTTLDYEKALKERGKLTLADFTKLETFESRVNLLSNLEYREDFNLGDIVTYTSKSWGITIDARIIEVVEVYEENGLSINLMFGDNIPTLTDKIKMVVR